MGMLSTGRTPSSLRDWSGSCPFVRRGLAVSFDFTAASQKLRTSWIFLDPIECATQLTGLAVRREDVGVEEHDDCTLEIVSTNDLGLVSQLTVITTPVKMMPRWNVFCVVLATFSRALN